MADGQAAAGEPRRGRLRVLLLLDRPLVGAIVTLALSHCACTVRATTTGTAALALVSAWQPHLAILDMDLDGRLVMAQLGVTGGGIRPAVIGLTRRGDLKTKLAALEWGVDDTLTTPFPLQELLARVIGQLRRSYSDVLTFTPLIRLGQLQINILDSTLLAGASPGQQLTPVELSLLYLLAANAGRVVTHEEILDTLWGADYVAESTLVDRHIRTLRAKLHHDARLPRFIVTRPGHGFTFVAGPDTR